MRPYHVLIAGLLCMATPSIADNDFKPSVNIDLQTRVSYLNDRVDHQIRHDASGFKGDYFFFRVSGQLTDRLTYSWRQRINQKKNENDRFDGGISRL